MWKITSCIRSQAGADRFLRQRFALSPNKAPGPALPGASRVAAEWSQPGQQYLQRAICVQGHCLDLCLACILGVHLIYGWRGDKEILHPKTWAKDGKRGCARCHKTHLTEFYSGTYTYKSKTERQLSLSRYFLTSLGIILIIEPFKLVQQKWIKLNSLLKLPEASQLSNEFL